MDCRQVKGSLNSQFSVNLSEVDVQIYFQSRCHFTLEATGSQAKGTLGRIQQNLNNMIKVHLCCSIFHLKIQNSSQSLSKPLGPEIATKV